MTTSAHPSTSILRGDSRLRRVLVVCLLAGYAVQIDLNMITVALPTIEHALRLTTVQSTWAVSGYVLAFALTLVVGGRLGDDYGRRRILLISMGLFAVTAVASSLAPGGTWLAVARICAGGVAGVGLPQIVGLIQQEFGGKERGHAFGFYSSAVSLSAVIAPLLGGGLIDATHHGWHLVFAPTALIALAALVVGYALLPRDTGNGHARLDLVGTALLGLSIVSIMLPVTEAGEKGAKPTWWLLATGLVLLAGFCWWEKHLESRGRMPMVRLDLFRVRSYSVGALTVLFFFAGYPGMLLLAQLYLQRGLHESAFSAAATTIPFGLASALAAMFSGRLVHRFGRWIVVAGCLAVTVGVGLTALLVSTRLRGDEALVLIVPFVVSGLGAGLIIAPNQTLAMAQVPRSEGSTAAGVYQVGMRVGQSVGIPLALTLYSSGLIRWHGDVFKAASFAMTSSAILIGLALVTRLVDILWTRHRAQAQPAAAESLGAMAAYARDEPGG